MSYKLTTHSLVQNCGIVSSASALSHRYINGWCIASITIHRKWRVFYNHFSYFFKWKIVMMPGKFLSMGALKVVILTTFTAFSDENFIKMITFSYQCWSVMSSMLRTFQPIHRTNHLTKPHKSFLFVAGHGWAHVIVTRAPAKWAPCYLTLQTVNYLTQFFLLSTTLWGDHAPWCRQSTHHHSTDALNPTIK